MVTDFVTRHLFRLVKFPSLDMDLQFETDPDTICQFALSKCELPENLTEQDWWKLARTMVYKEVGRLRNDKAKALKGAFFGRFDAVE